MKYIAIQDIDTLPGKRMGPGDTFSFRCHPEITCFNLCCRNLNLFLYPYDIIRLKKRLGMSSAAFIDTHVDVVMRPASFFPEVLLRMSENREKTCPFLRDSGCSVYADRPDACRTFPVEQGVLYDDESGTTTPVYFFRPPDFCLGRHEKKVWTIQSWTEDQEAVLYHKMTVRWAELKRLFQTDPWGDQGPEGPRAKMAFMATYNLDTFRDFIFNSTFLKRYRVKSALIKKIKADDAALMAFGFEWVKFYIWGTRATCFSLR